jgi:hypothetical protein
MTINGENPINKDGCIDHHFFPAFKGKPIREIAHQVAMLEDNPPDSHIILFDGTTITRKNPALKEHWDHVFHLRQEMTGRCGEHYTQQYIDEARKIIKLMS